jgi:hypothetical protein
MAPSVYSAIAAQCERAPGRKHRARPGKHQGPQLGLEQDRLDRERRREQRDAAEQNQAGAERAIHLSASIAGSWR